jgi:hypothetical protein
VDLPPSPIRGASLAQQLAVTVVIRWKDHDRFQSQAEAVGALCAAANLVEEQAEQLLVQVAAAHEAAVIAVPRHVRPRRFKIHPFASSRDIDEAACLSAVTAAAPDLPEVVRRYIVGWVIHWHWVR